MAATRAFRRLVRPTMARPLTAKPIASQPGRYAALVCSPGLKGIPSMAVINGMLIKVRVAVCPLDPTERYSQYGSVDTTAATNQTTYMAGRRKPASHMAAREIGHIRGPPSPERLAIAPPTATR